MRPTRIFGGLVLVAALALAGCEDDDTPAVTTTTSTTVDASTTSTTEAPAVAVVLEAEGLRVADFGDPKTAVVAALTAALGAPDGTGTGCELAGTDVTTTSWKELTVQFADGVFDSYGVRVAPSESAELGLRTEDGIGIGSTVAQLQAAYGARLAIPGFPEEFGEPNSFAISFPGTDRSLRGALSGTAATDRVETFLTQFCE